MRHHDKQIHRQGTHRIALLLGALLVGMAWAAPSEAQSPSANPPPLGMQGDAFDAGGEAKVVPLPWSQLNPAQREMLDPLRSQWDQLPPRRQQRMAAHAEQWAQLPPERRERIQQRLARWALMTPEQRREAARGEQAFRAMSEPDRRRVMDAYRRFQSLSPQQRRALIQKFRAEHRGMHEPPPRH